MKLSRSRVLVASGVVALLSGVGLTLALAGDGGGQDLSAAPSGPASTGPDPVIFDEASATLSRQDAYSTTSVDKNGVFRTALSPTVVNVKIGDEWVPASATLTDDGASGLEALEHPLALSLAPTASDPELVSVSSRGYSVTFALKGAADAPLEHVVDSAVPSTEADHAVYAEVFPGTDLEYDVSPSALKESVVLSEAPISGDVAFTWSVNAPGLVVEENEFGDLEFLDPAGEVIFSMPLAVMWDSSGVEGVREPADANIPYEVAQVGDGAYDVTLRPGAEWLGDSARVYPVYVDPTLVTGPFMLREYKQDGVVYAKDVRVGRTQQNSTCCNWRSVAAYDYSSLMSKQITSAEVYSSRLGGTANCYGGGVYNAYEWSYANAGVWEYFSGFANCTTGYAGENIYQLIASWVKANNPYGALVYTGAEYNAYSYKILATTLYIYWVEAPTVTGVTASTPQGGATAVAFPVMQATGTFSAGSNQFFQYIFTSTDGGAAWTSPWTSSGPYRVPDGALTPGKHYTYNIKTKDDYPVSPEPTFTFATHPTWHFTMDSAPNAPTDVTVDGQALTTNVTSSVVRPVVGATVSDVDGGNPWALFTVRQDGIVIVDSLPGSAADVNGVSTATLPYALSPDATYTIEVRTSDGYLVSATTLAPTFTFTGPPGTNREIPGTSDSQTGATP